MRAVLSDDDTDDEDLLAAFNKAAGAMESQLSTAAESIAVLHSAEDEDITSSSGEELPDASDDWRKLAGRPPRPPSQDAMTALASQLEQTRDILAATTEENEALHFGAVELEQRNREVSNLQDRLLRQTEVLSGAKSESIALHDQLNASAAEIAEHIAAARATAVANAQLEAALEEARANATAAGRGGDGDRDGRLSPSSAALEDAARERFDHERREQRRRSRSSVEIEVSRGDDDDDDPSSFVHGRVAAIEAQLAEAKASAAREARRLKSELAASRSEKERLALELAHAHRESLRVEELHTRTLTDREELSATVRTLRRQLSSSSPRSPGTPMGPRTLADDNDDEGEDDDDFAAHLHAAYVDELQEQHAKEMELQQEQLEARFAAERGAIESRVGVVVARAEAAEAELAAMASKHDEHKGVLSDASAEAEALRVELAAKEELRLRLKATLRSAKDELADKAAEVESYEVSMKTSRRNTPQRQRLADAKLRRQEKTIEKLRESNARLREKVAEASKLMVQVCSELEGIRKERALAVKERALLAKQKERRLSSSQAAGGSEKKSDSSTSARRRRKRSGSGNSAAKRGSSATKSTRGRRRSRGAKRQITLG